MRNIRVFTGNSNAALAQELCAYLDVPLGRARVGAFSDSEVMIEVDESVRGLHAFVIQSTSTPVNQHLMELLVLIDALKRASAEEITAVVPYFGYARQDRKVASRAPITAKLVADLLQTAGATRLISMDLHAGQIQGFFNIPVDHLYAMPLMLNDVRERFRGKKVVIVSPDAGGVERARAYAKRLNAAVSFVDKRRPSPNVSEVMNIVGDVAGMDCILLDDMVDTAGTLTQAATALLKEGATSVMAYATHPVLSGPAIARIEQSPLQEVVVSNTIALHPEARACKKIRQLSVATLIGEAVRRVHTGESISTLFA
ncbi:MAG: ribose-phosphate pyrophosphokinase [Deltaproteobacteria bacterium]|nr:ribose-phosphate pyrophosphokinase [Deltaproteobacteria bacterium]